MEDAQAQAFADDILARQALARDRLVAITEAPEAEERQMLAFALACRSDVPVRRARALMIEAPEMTVVADIAAWVDAVDPKPRLEIVR